MKTCITARQARMKFVDEDYVTAMIAVNEAIVAAAPSSHKACINIATGHRKGDYCVAYHVSKSLQEKGFDVVMIHDGENGSSELSIDWANKVQ